MIAGKTAILGLSCSRYQGKASPRRELGNRALPALKGRQYRSRQCQATRSCARETAAHQKLQDSSSGEGPKKPELRRHLEKISFPDGGASGEKTGTHSKRKARAQEENRASLPKRNTPSSRRWRKPHYRHQKEEKLPLARSTSPGIGSFAD